MTTIDTARLRALAEKATTGPWAHYGTEPFEVYDLKEYSNGEPGPYVAKWVRDYDDAAYIAAADPQTVIALLDEIERLRGGGEWEYAKQYTDEGGNPRAPRFVPFTDLSRPDGHRADGTPYWNFTAIRRRKAGPWELIPEGEGDGRAE